MKQYWYSVTVTEDAPTPVLEEDIVRGFKRVHPDIDFDLHQQEDYRYELATYEHPLDVAAVTAAIERLDGRQTCRVVIRLELAS